MSVSLCPKRLTPFSADSGRITVNLVNALSFDKTCPLKTSGADIHWIGILLQIFLEEMLLLFAGGIYPNNFKLQIPVFENCH